MSRNSQAFNITLPKELVKKIDKLAEREYTSRSDIIRQSIIRELREEESKTWTSVADFTKINPGGVPAAAVLKAIDALLA